jgi:hypothetical protein
LPAVVLYFAYKLLLLFCCFALHVLLMLLLLLLITRIRYYNCSVVYKKKQIYSMSQKKWGHLPVELTASQIKKIILLICDKDF